MPELRIETGPQKAHTLLLRPPGPFLIGRDLEADFPLFDRRVSRAHFRIEFHDDGYRLLDLRSKAGTLVNDAAVQSILLQHGDRIAAGSTIFTFRVDHPDDPLVKRSLGPYGVLERVGRGGMGTVYRAVQRSLERIVALKVLADELTRDAERCALFVSEAKAAGELSHPNIVRVYDVNLLDGVLFYAMEIMAQGSAADLLEQEGPLPIERAVSIALEASSGLVYAERMGIVHRDIKPSNLMLSETGAVKIGDLGIATRLQDLSQQGGKGGISGSPHYMSPEQALGRAVTPRADVYALGASLHQLVAGTPPFLRKSLKEVLLAQVRDVPPGLETLRQDAPPALVELVSEMLAKDPLARPEAAEVEGRLRQIRDEEAARPPPAPVRPRRRRAWRRWTVAAVLVLGLGILLGAYSTYLTTLFHAREQRMDRVRATIAEGRAALGRGDLETARAKLLELARLRGSEDEWQQLSPEINAFEREVRARGK